MKAPRVTAADDHMRRGGFMNENTFTNYKIGFIGFGAMAQALADGWIHSGLVEPSQMSASRRDYDVLVRETARRGMGAYATNARLAKWADIVVVCVKPWAVEEVVTPLRDILRSKIVVSVASGVSFEDYERFLDEGTQHWSILPNTPVAVGKGVLCAEVKHSLDPAVEPVVSGLLSLLGLVKRFGPSEFKAAGLVSGCGPAFAAMMIEGLADGAVKHGLKRAEAYELVSAMLEGTALLQRETETQPGVMKDAVCSPAGSTIRGVAALEKRAFRSSLIEAVDAIMEA